jgi:hypothetical protein
MVPEVRLSGRGFAAVLRLRIVLGVLSATACASESQQCGIDCPAGDVSLGCVCDGYSGTEVCGGDPSFALCTGACSGGPCCDPGFLPTPIVYPSGYNGCRPGPIGFSNTLCCPSGDADADADADDESRCPASCASAADCTGTQVCCSSHTSAGSACLDGCGTASQLCVTSSECQSNWMCSGGTCQPPVGSCGNAVECGTGSLVCCFDPSSAFSSCNFPPCSSYGEEQLCSGSAECPAGSTCELSGSGTSICSPSDGEASDVVTSDAPSSDGPDVADTRGAADSSTDGAANDGSVIDSGGQ